MSHPSAIEAGSFGFHWGSLSLGNVGSKGSSIEPVWWSLGVGGCVHRYRLVSHPARGVARVILVLLGSLVGSEWRAEALSLPEGWERSWCIGCSSVCFKDIDYLPSFGGTDSPTFDFVVV